MHKIQFSPATIRDRRQRLKDSLNERVNRDDLVVIASGSPIQKPGGHDQTYSFLPNPDYYYVTGRREHSEICVYSKDHGFVDFHCPWKFEDLVWEGKERHRSSLEAKEDLGLDDLRSIDKLDAFCKQNFNQVIFVGCPSAGYEKQLKNIRRASEAREFEVGEAWNRIRRKKDPEEIQLIETCAKAASAGFSHLENILEPGVSERYLQVEYEKTVYHHGGHKMPYGTIVGTGTSAAIAHGTPSEKTVKPGDIVLVDAGCDIDDYCVDITRVFTPGHKLSSQQQAINDIVASAQNSCISMAKPGVEWSAVHINAATVITEGLVALGILKGSTEDLLESGATSLFFPHGVGHMVGHRVRDVGAILGKPPKYCYGIRLRLDIALEPGFCMTVEPGVYFIKSMLMDSSVREKHPDNVVWTEVDKWLDFGGVRLEDDILITSEGNRNLTEFIPKTGV